MAEDSVATGDPSDGDWADDPILRAQQIDALMTGPPANLPPIVVVGDDAVFGIRPVRRPA